MNSVAQPISVSKTRNWTGVIISALLALFLLFDGVMKLIKPPFVVEKTVQLGYSEQSILPLGIVLLTSTIIYIFPRTAVLGAILLTGYLGGAVATHVRAGGSVIEILFPAIFGALLWVGLALRDARLPEYLRSGAQTASVSSRKIFWVGVIIGILPSLGLIFSAVGKLSKMPQVLSEFHRLGYPESVSFGLGILEISCTIIYLIPRVSVLGAILLTGYLGGVVATHTRMGDTVQYIFTIPFVFGTLFWLGLYLRNKQLRELLPLRKI